MLNAFQNGMAENVEQFMAFLRGKGEKQPGKG